MTEMIEVNAHRFGVHAGQVNWTYPSLATLWQTAESLGYDLVSMFDHLRPPDGGDTGMCLEGLSLAAAMAASTRKLRCALLVAAVTFRHPMLLATAAATIDHISGGRFELGVGAGGPDLSHQESFAVPALGQRIQMLDELCIVLRRLWTEDVTSFTGRHYRLERAHLWPKPLQAHPPLIVGGAGPRMLRVVARHADIWNTFVGDPAQYREQCRRLERECARIDRDPASIRRSLVFRAVLAPNERVAIAKADGIAPAGSPSRRTMLAGTPAQVCEALGAFSDAGARDFLLGVRASLDVETLTLVATEVAPAFRKAA